MKRLLVFVFALIVTTGLSQSYNFCEGWERGFEKGYCKATEGSANAIGCVAPPAPPCGIPDIGEDNFAGGYDAGYEEGMNEGRNEGSSGSNRSRVDPALINNSAESLNKAAVNVANSLDKLFSDPDYIAYRKKKKEEKKNRKRNKPKSSNWISLSSGFQHHIIPRRNLNLSNVFGHTNHQVNHALGRSFFITELNYSHRHFLNSNSSMSYDGGIFFDYMNYNFDTVVWMPTPISVIELSFSGRILHSFHFNRFLINTGFGMSLITIGRRENYEPLDITNNIWYTLRVGDRYHYFGIIGLNIKLDNNNELGIRTNYQLYNNFYYQLEKRFIFQLKFNHRL